MRLLITGGRGLLGKEIAAAFCDRAEVRSTDLEELDVTNPAACRREVDGFRPDMVIHCAAWTAVDRAESEPERTRLLNVEGTRNVARACRERGALMVTFGTDYIFDGTSSRPYREEDAANPLSVYGKTKWAAELALREEGGDHLLVRTQWMFGPAGRNFIRTILEKARRGETLRVASDQVGCPTFSRDLAAAVRNLLGAGARGTVHFSSVGETTWFGLARHVLERCGLPAALLSPAQTRDLPYPAPRPAYGVLSKEKYRAITGVSPRPWEEAVGEYLEMIESEGGTR
ncbi:MAG TPA: dTDP-4-dehydrorhamnose reductase [Thermodesulfobacteriota bacterium]|nr:dTDP-4-dehydrorhamnose reductase [Deltaproteobacteria bacterium]HQT98207.1 dTDP-4-dehydrorhamnose reductase [Thermodesulfobacteriota bacterium]